MDPLVLRGSKIKRPPEGPIIGSLFFILFSLFSSCDSARVYEIKIAGNPSLASVLKDLSIEYHGGAFAYRDLVNEIEKIDPQAKVLKFSFNYRPLWGLDRKFIQHYFDLHRPLASLDYIDNLEGGKKEVDLFKVLGRKGAYKLSLKRYKKSEKVKEKSLVINFKDLVYIEDPHGHALLEPSEVTHLLVITDDNHPKKLREFLEKNRPKLSLGEFQLSEGFDFLASYGTKSNE